MPRSRNVWSAQAPASSIPEALQLSVIVVCHKMQAQIRNTLISLKAPYQRDIHPRDYEIIVVDNGSPQPLPDDVWQLADNIRYQYIPPEEASANPGVAINQGVASARGKFVCLMIDGARMVTPGVLHWGLRLLQNCPNALAEVRGWHLGNKVQMQSVLEGHSAETECELLKRIAWPGNGYRLFEISVPAESTKSGFQGRGTETTCAFMSRSLFHSISGFDERYVEPGGGLVNFDFFWRATAAAQVVYTILGEGTFHQVHGGAATSLAPQERRETFRRWREEYDRLSRRFENRPPPYDPVLAGHVPPECQKWLAMPVDETND
jgi:GT2 family glycosyltransferase